LVREFSLVLRLLGEPCRRSRCLGFAFCLGTDSLLRFPNEFLASRLALAASVQLLREVIGLQNSAAQPC
jgi:hypothetical protein